MEYLTDLPEYAEYAQLHREFLKDGERIGTAAADFHYLPADGILAGMHNGAHFYTIGQRKGLNIGGKAEPMFVIATDTVNNNLYVGMGHDHPGLNRWGLFIPQLDIHWIRTDLALHAGEYQADAGEGKIPSALQQAGFIHERGRDCIFFSTKSNVALPPVSLQRGMMGRNWLGRE